MFGGKEFESLEDLQRFLDKTMQEQNNRSLTNFVGYSPIEMNNILYHSFENNSVVRLKKLSTSEYQSVPIFNMVKYLAGLIENKGEMKLTLKGFLPIKVVADIYNQGFFKEKHIESGVSKLYKETDSSSIHLVKILLLISGLAKKRNNKLSITRAGKKIIPDNHLLLTRILKAYTSKYNWAYADGYGENNIGQLGSGFTLILINKYGGVEHSDDFYAEKYFKAFPDLINSLDHPGYGTINDYANDCFSYRSFNRFLNYFGLIVLVESGKILNRQTTVSKTPMFDNLIEIQPHKAGF